MTPHQRTAYLRHASVPFPPPVSQMGDQQIAAVLVEDYFGYPADLPLTLRLRLIVLDRHGNVLESVACTYERTDRAEELMAKELERWEDLRVMWREPMTGWRKWRYRLLRWLWPKDEGVLIGPGESRARGD